MFKETSKSLAEDAKQAVVDIKFQKDKFLKERAEEQAKEAAELAAGGGVKKKNEKTDD